MIKTLKSKMSLIYLCLVLMIAIVGCASVVNLYSLGRSIEGLMTDNYKSIGAVNHMLEAIERQDSAIMTYINTEERQEGIDLFTENNSSFLQWYGIEYGNITEREESKLVEGIRSNYAEYTGLFSSLQEIRNSKGLNDSIAFYNEHMVPKFDRITKLLKEVITVNEKAMFAGKNQATNTTRHSMYVILALTFLALSCGFLASRYFVNRFLAPINSLTETIKLVKAGDLNQQAKIGSQDEIGELAHEFNNMTKRLQQYEQSTLGRIVSEKNRTLAVIKSIADPIIVLDLGYRILLINNACEDFFDISEDNVTGRHFLEAIRNGSLFDFISGSFDAQTETMQKIMLIDSNKEDFYFNIVIKIIKDDGSNPTGFVVVFQNVTQLKLLEKIRTDFIATISHEFKTPLTSIIIGTSLLQNESVGVLNGEQKDILDAIMEDGERLSTLVSDLLELTKIESGMAVYKFEDCIVSEIVDDSIGQFLPQANRNEVILSNKCGENLPKVKADREKITWVLNNLISNALKYTNTGDEITISAELNRNMLHITVKDTGIGIPEDYAERIFDKFVQVRDEDPEIRGTGLGLALAKGIVQAHGGSIWCESKLDTGSSFTFTLCIV